MLVLAVDTAGPDCAVALVRSETDGVELLARVSESLGRGHAERLMPMIESVLSQAGHGFDDLDRVAVTLGPGSFTGVRVAIAAARGLALALDIPAVGVGTLDALAFPILCAESSGTAVAVLDAKRGELFALVRDIATRATLLTAQALSADTLAARLGAASEPLILTGSGAPILAALLTGRDVRIAGTAASPEIADVARLGRQAEASGSPAPLYLRGADAKPQRGLIGAEP
jgi:tRNA threonylcarbamoyladenosine biosynthesis protein TsaB